MENKSLIFILNKLRGSAINFAKFIQQNPNKWDKFLINCPASTQKLIENYTKGELLNREFWDSWQELFNLADPFVNAIRYQLEPIIQILPFLLKQNPEMQIISYLDDTYFQITEQFKEQILLLTFKTKVTHKINIEAWKEVLYDDFQWSKSYSEKADATILKNMSGKHQILILYQGSIKNLKNTLADKGYSPKVRYSGNYWRAPLEVLSYLTGLKHLQNIPDSCIQHCIEAHLLYINLIIIKSTLDEAHRQWMNNTFKLFI